MAEKDESMHWADRIVEEVVKRVASNPKLKKIVKEKGYVCMDEKTPSGEIHIGSGRGWVIHDVVAKAFRDRGLKAKFILSSDDIDPFDKWNEGLDPKFKKYLGMPFMNIPSPVKGYKSFAEYYFKKCTDKFPEFGIEAELESTGQAYIRGDFNEAIKIALDKAEKIQEIFMELYGEDVAIAKRLPFNPICEKCGKIATTEAYAWDGKEVKYRCKKDMVKYVEGCGHEGSRSPYDGAGKLPWKVEWAAKWPTFGVVYETAGKDHFTKKGSRDVAIRIADKVYDFEPPYPSTREKMGKGYEFFQVGGKKMSTSKGTGISFAESTELAPAKILRYLLVRTRPHAVIDFNPSERNDLILLYDRYDKTERMYYGVEKDENDAENLKQKRIYELSHIGEIPKKMIPQIPFTHAAVTIQSAITQEKAIETLKQTGHLPKKPSKEQLDYAKERLSFAEKWVRELAPEQYVFRVNEPKEVSYELKDGDEIKALVALKEALESKEWEEKDLFNEFYAICEKTGLDNRDFFKMMYQIIVSKDRGPKLAPFIITLGKGRVLKLIEKALAK